MSFIFLFLLVISLQRFNYFFDDSERVKEFHITSLLQALIRPVAPFYEWVTTAEIVLNKEFLGKWICKLFKFYGRSK